MLTNAQIERANRIRAAMDNTIPEIKDKPSAINNAMDMLRPWEPGAFNVDDVRMYEGIPYKCVQAHDSKANPGWTPVATPALWMQYHGTSPETARPWVQPTGAHDVYKVGEFMIFTDGKTYMCLDNTNFSPAEYAAAWEIVGA